VSDAYVFNGERLAPSPTGSTRPLRWAAWRPDGSSALIAGNRGAAALFDGRDWKPLASGTTHNLRGAAWSPDGDRALLVGNRGAMLLLERGRFRELPAATTENLRRAAWHPDGSFALAAGNGGVVLRYDAGSDAVYPLPGDRAHTLRSIAWRPDGAYALVGGYASRFAGYPRPYALYRCDGRYLQGILSSDDEDDAVAIDWRPGGQEALIVVTAYDAAGRLANKLVEYDGAGVRTTPIEAPAAMLGGAWCPDGSYALLCGESGTLIRAGDGAMTPFASGTKDNLVGPFFRPGDPTMALVLKGPAERVYTV
jgi:hypothetical protein